MDQSLRSSPESPCPPSRLEDDITVNTADELTALHGLTTVAGDLTIDGSDLSDLTDLECLAQVDGKLSVFRNERLVSLEGLHNLWRVGAFVHISANPTLKSLRGLRKLQSVGGILHSLEITGNDSLTNVEALFGVSVLDGDLRVTNNPVLPACDAVELSEEIFSIRGEITIEGNDHPCDAVPCAEGEICSLACNSANGYSCL